VGVGSFDLACLDRGLLAFLGLLEVIAFSIDLDDLSTVGEAVDKRHRAGGVREDLAPVVEVLLRGNQEQHAFRALNDFLSVHDPRELLRGTQQWHSWQYLRRQAREPLSHFLAQDAHRHEDALLAWRNHYPSTMSIQCSAHHFFRWGPPAMNWITRSVAGSSNKPAPSDRDKGGLCSNTRGQRDFSREISPRSSFLQANSARSSRQFAAGAGGGYSRAVTGVSSVMHRSKGPATSLPRTMSWISYGRAATEQPISRAHVGQVTSSNITVTVPGTVISA
jgi:hypothetical protein